MRCIALKTDGVRYKYSFIALGIVVLVVGLTAIVSHAWYAILFCSVFGGGYLIWSGYLEITVLKKLRGATLSDQMNIRFSDEGQYLFIEYDDEPDQSTESS